MNSGLSTVEMGIRKESMLKYEIPKEEEVSFGLFLEGFMGKGGFDDLLKVI